MNTGNFYKLKCEEAVKKAFPRLRFKYNAMEYLACNDDAKVLQDKSKWYKQFLIKIKILDEEKKFILAIPKSFPYEFPRIYLTQEDADYKNLPHVDDKLFVCTFDSYEAQPNSDYPAEVIFQTIQKAKHIITDGALKENWNDYQDEFLVYWKLEAKNKIISIIEPNDVSKSISVIDLEILMKNLKSKLDLRFDKNTKQINSLASLNQYRYLIADDDNAAINWLMGLGITISRNVVSKVIKEGVFLPIDRFGNPPFPSTNVEIINCINKNSQKDLQNIYKFLSANERPSLIVFGIKHKDYWMLGAWRHSNVIDEKIKGTKKIPLRHIQGFRNDKHPLSLEMKQPIPITKYSIERFDKKRLFQRGGAGLITDQKYKINLIGCGSVGSYLAYDLVKIGFNELVFVDDEILCTENLARHYCGIEYINKNKVESLKHSLCEKYPHLNISTEVLDIRSLILDNIDFLNKTNLNILAIADYSTEMMINEAYQNGLISVPILIVWVEPYVKAGQAVLLLPKKEGCFKCLFEVIDGYNSFKYAVSKEIDLIKEAGCHSTYMPYGAVDLSSFTIFLAKIIDKIHNDEFFENTLFQFVKNDDELSHSLSIKTFAELENFACCCEGIN